MVVSTKQGGSYNVMQCWSYFINIKCLFPILQSIHKLNISLYAYDETPEHNSTRYLKEWIFQNSERKNPATYLLLICRVSSPAPFKKKLWICQVAPPFPLPKASKRCRDSGFLQRSHIQPMQKQRHPFTLKQSILLDTSGCLYMFMRGSLCRSQDCFLDLSGTWW